jgi:outer membrane protein OmpA-like peptidoglycan-associated protein
MQYKKSTLTLAVITAAFLMGGCAPTAQQATTTTGTANTQKGVAIGALAGAALGNLIGKKSKSTMIGAAAGAAIGGAIGYSLDKQAAEVAKSLETEVNTNPNAEATSDADIIVTKTDRYVKITFRDKMMFPTNSDQPTPTARYKIEKLIGVLRNYPQTVIQVVGHTDNRGSYAYNQVLSKKRARTVANMLISGGVPNPIYEKGCSYAKPVVPNSSPENMALNRRVEVYLYPNKDMIVDPCI